MKKLLLGLCHKYENTKADSRIQNNNMSYTRITLINELITKNQFHYTM